MRRAGWMLLASVAAVGMLLLFVFPGRTLLDQNRAVALAQQHITSLDRENAQLRARRALLEDPAQIEQLARQRYDMVLPGQTIFAITPPPPTGPAPAAAVKASARPWWRDLELWH